MARFVSFPLIFSEKATTVVENQVRPVLQHQTSNGLGCAIVRVEKKLASHFNQLLYMFPLRLERKLEGHSGGIELEKRVLPLTLGTVFVTAIKYY